MRKPVPVLENCYCKWRADKGPATARQIIYRFGKQAYDDHVYELLPVTYDENAEGFMISSYIKEDVSAAIWKAGLAEVPRRMRNKRGRIQNRAFFLCFLDYIGKAVSAGKWCGPKHISVSVEHFSRSNRKLSCKLYHYSDVYDELSSDLFEKRLEELGIRCGFDDDAETVVIDFSDASPREVTAMRRKLNDK